MEIEKPSFLYLAKEQLKHNPLYRFSNAHMEDIIGNILMHGIVRPLTVFGPFSDGSYMLLSGEKNFTAFCSLVEDGKIEDSLLPCYVYADAGLNQEIQKKILQEFG